MEPTIPSQPPPTQPITPMAPAPVKPKNNLLSVFVVIILLLSFSAVGFLAYQNWQLKQQISQVQPTSTSPTSPSPITTSVPTLDPTVNWKTYTNSIHGFSFKYPSDWVLNSERDNDQYNANLNLKKGNNIIGIVANMDGIGGGPRNVPFEEINLWGKTYYKQYGDINFSAGTKIIDICDSPHGLGVFRINNKTFMISLTYPTNTEGEKPTLTIGKEFDQILSTFKFTN